MQAGGPRPACAGEEIAGDAQSHGTEDRDDVALPA
jgi:hypothetical protein